ncbi:hypothetical protein OG194_00990 [Streptomyces sp. NBC_01288]|uniref:hypothetical protein n=1 Tax=Streptomyces sp. NBC_01288 TaxID=2903814 RepID=UPI002E0E9C5F|nr:hypothetical protein OG194_00990 [Streptomyces sp. NBC_01288]
MAGDGVQRVPVRGRRPLPQLLAVLVHGQRLADRLVHREPPLVAQPRSVGQRLEDRLRGAQFEAAAGATR